jgi:DNA-binding transcriptional MocR family regulator
MPSQHEAAEILGVGQSTIHRALNPDSNESKTQHSSEAKASATNSFESKPEPVDASGDDPTR